MRVASAILFSLCALIPLVGMAQEKSEITTQKLAFVEVIDGDTIRVRLDGRVVSLRLLNIDTEETYHDDASLRRRAEGDFEAYVKQQQRGSNRPTKYGTPFGEAGRIYAEKFFKGIETVEVECDHPAEKTGHFGRLLSYVFIVRDGKRLFFNVEAVRQGLSPYYTKYGRSRRFSAEFEAAEKEAKAAKVGMWGNWKEQKCYPDYEQRLKWWNERAQVYDQWRSRVAANDKLPADKQENLIDLAQHHSFKKLKALKGKKAVIFGSINRIRHPSKRNSVVLFSANKDLVDLILGGRVNDGGKYNREIGIGAGTVTFQDNKVRLTGGTLEVPSLKVSALDIEKSMGKGKGKGKSKNKSDNSKKAEGEPKKNTGYTPKADSNRGRSSHSKVSKLNPNWRPESEHIKVQYRGQVGEIIKQISMECNVNVIYGELPQDLLSRKVRIYFDSITPGQALQACAVAADLPHTFISPNILVISRPDSKD